MIEPKTAAVLAIGTELVRGEIVNTNGAWLAERLIALGFEVRELAVVEDDPDRIADCLRRLCDAHDVVVATGGLGPTTDDITTEVVASVLQVPLVRDVASFHELERRYAAAGRELFRSNVKQVDFPQGAAVLANAVGTAPGFTLSLGRSCAVFMPGVPREMTPMFVDYVEPLIASMVRRLSHQIRLKTFGLPESIVGEKLRGIEQEFPGITVGYRAHFPETEVKLLARSVSHESARGLAARARRAVEERLGAIIYGEGATTLPQATAQALRARGRTLSLAESCTGGMLAQLLTVDPASDYFLAGIVSYSNRAKEGLLGVSAATLRDHGAVSEACAREMAESIRALTESDIALSITGIAGPTGGTAEKPLGLVHFALAHRGGTLCQQRTFANCDRRQVQRYACFVALDWIRRIALES